MEINMAKALVVVSLICFVLAVFNVSIGYNLIALGLAFYVASSLVG